MSEYNRILAADQRFQSASATAHKTGGAYSGYRPRQRRSSWSLVAIAIAIVLLAIQGLAYVH